jgi:hypothetical protein
MIKMKMFGFMPPPPTKTKVASGGGGGVASAGKMFNMKNLASIMKVKSTGCKSCGG